MADDLTPKKFAQKFWRQVLQDEEVLQRARSNFTVFKQVMMSNYQHAPHLDYIDRHLMAIEKAYREKDFSEVKRNLMIEIPPRHGKSYTVARLFPAWFLGRNPNARIILASYGASLSEKHSKAIRFLIRSKRYQSIFPTVKISEESKAKDAWDLAPPYVGGLDAVGKGGAMTGKGADLIITDDLVKGRLEAESANLREQDWDWLQNDLLTRRETPYAIHVAIGTRWHEDDVHGRIHRYESDLWDFITLPAFALEDDPLGRAVGEPLWKERFPAKFLHEARRRLGDYGFESLYQQRPFTKEGNLFFTNKIAKIASEPPRREMRLVVRFWDLAMSANERADYTVGVKMGLWNDNVVILDMVRVQVEWSEVVALISQIAQLDGPSVFVGIEETFYQSSAVRELLRRPQLMNYSIRGVRVDADKFTRALPLAARVNVGMCYMVEGDWNQALQEELRSFPMGAHDDIVDALSGAYNLLSSVMPIRILKTNIAS